jgi:tartrate dehydratase beta subunit/fumarate hydratase class I family protein
MKKYALAVLATMIMVTGALADTNAADRHGLIGDDQVISLTNHALFDSGTFKSQDRVQMAQQGPTTTVQTSAPVTSTTVVKGGDLAAQIIQWLQVAFGSTIGGVALYIFVRGLNYIGIKITAENKAQLQGIIVNGLNAAAARAEVQLKNNPNLDINVKSKIIADAVGYAQDHGAETIKALGLDPKSGEAVEAINARIQTALNDPTVPTPAVITPANGQPQVNKVIVNGAQV